MKNAEKLVDAFVVQANNISTSGRWDGLNEKIKYLEITGTQEKWYVQTIGSLCFLVFNEYSLLKKNHKEMFDRDASLLAWRARNLLELFIWSTYFSKSIKNARIIYVDAGRDSRDLLNTFKKWGVKTERGTDWHQLFAKAIQDIDQKAASVGIENLDSPYTRVNKAAEECGLGEPFNVNYKMLSKFAHPTAMQISGSSDGSKNAGQRDLFFSNGCLFFGCAFETLERHMNKLTNPGLKRE